MKHVDIAVIAPHQDDEVIGCGGTLNLLTQKGFFVGVVHVFSGTSNVLNYSGKLAKKIREMESQKAANILGYNIIPCLDLKDREEWDQVALTKKIIKFIRQYKPTIIFSPHEYEQDFEHKLVAKAVREAQWMASSPIFPEFGKPVDSIHALIGYEIWKAIDTVNFFVDITPIFENKISALKEFKSQIATANWLSGSLGLNAYRGVTLNGSGYAEAFTIRVTNNNYINFLGSLL